MVYMKIKFVLLYIYNLLLLQGDIVQLRSGMIKFLLALYIIKKIIHMLCIIKLPVQGHKVNTLQMQKFGDSEVEHSS